jgi:hypothetical protein
VDVVALQAAKADAAKRYYSKAQVDAKTLAVAKPAVSGLAAVQAISGIKWLFTPVSGFFSDVAGTTEQTTDAGSVKCWKDASGNADHATDATGLTLAQGIAGGVNALNVNASTARLKTTGTFDSSFNAGFTYFAVAYDPTVAANKVIVSSGDGRWYHAWNGSNQGFGPVFTAGGGLPTATLPIDIPTAANADPIPGNTQIECVRYNGPSVKGELWFDGYYAKATTVASATALALTGVLTIGGLGSGFSWGGKILAFAAWNRILTDAEVAVVTDYLSQVTLSQPRALLQLIGNSLTSGTGSSSGAVNVPGTSGTGYAAFTLRSYPSQLMHEFPGRDVLIRVDAYPGRRQTQIIAELSASTQAMFTPSTHPRRVAVVWELTNEIANDLAANYAAVSAGTVPPAYTSLVTICQTLQSQGWIVGVATCMPRSDLANAGLNSQFYRTYQHVNAMIRRNFTGFAQFLVDIAADPRLGTPGRETDLTYFSGDLCHMNDAGYNIVKDLVKGAVAPFLPSSRPYPVVTKSVAGAVDVTLKSGEFAAVTSLGGAGIITLTGAITANINVLLPRVAGARATFVNSTSGAFTVTLKSSTGTGYTLTQGKRAVLLCDGTNWLQATPEV